MSQLKDLEYKYSKDYKDIFEDIATLMFCTDIGLSNSVNQRINQKAIESEPVQLNGNYYSYQAKYYDASTRLSEHKKELIDSIKGAFYAGTTNLYFFINKDKPDKNYKTGKEPKYIEEIENTAKDLNIKIHWWTKSKIEKSLDMPNFKFIKELYFERGGVSGLGENIKKYYDYIMSLYKARYLENNLLGNESLEELYMQPTYFKSKYEIGDVEQLFNEFISERESGVLWIVGEPGHGKTSMCMKAVADFVNKMNYQQVKGVFWFRLNPQGTSEMVGNQQLDLEKAFSWGTMDYSRKIIIEAEKMRGCLVFLDGFDELKSSLEVNNVLYNQFYTQVNQIAKMYQMHIVVTSRTRALEQDGSFSDEELKTGDAIIKCKFRDGGSQKNDVKLLAPLTKEKQMAWINGLISHRKKNGKNTSDLERYKQKFQSLQINKDIARLLEVPILLRMIVQNCFEPLSDNRVNLYRDIFEVTLSRQGLENQIDKLRSTYQEIAFRIFLYDDDSTEIKKGEFATIDVSDAYLYQYYLYTPEKEVNRSKKDKYRISFFHRSFYQYFLSEFLYTKLETISNDQDGMEYLKYLWARRLDDYVLDNLRYRAKDVDIACKYVLRAIEETDAVLPVVKNALYSKESIRNYEKVNNIFCNGISICNSIFQNEKSQDVLKLTGRTVELLSKYNCFGIFLSRSILSAVDLSGANLSGANLSGADLRYANLSSANLDGANLTNANLSHSDLINANLRGANLSGANLNDTNLSRANMNGANLSNTMLIDANLSAAGLVNTDLRFACLRFADLSHASLRYADLSHAILIRADMSFADLNIAILYGAELGGAYLRYADLTFANLCDANLCLADLRGSNLNRADLSTTNFSGTNFDYTKISYDQYDYVIKQDANNVDKIILINNVNSQ